MSKTVSVAFEDAMTLAQQHEQAATAISTEAGQYVINDDAEFQQAAEFLHELNRRIKMLENTRKSFTAPLREVTNNINAFFKPPTETYKHATGLIKTAMTDYKRRAEALRQQKLREAAAAAEKLRLAAAQEKEAEAQPAAEEFRTALAASQAFDQPTAEGVYTRRTVEFEIENAEDLPMRFLMPNEAAIREEVKQLGLNAKIPGVRVFEKETIVTRTPTK